MESTGSLAVTAATRDAFTGELLTPGDDGYDEARRVHNGLINKRPALIARCRSAADVVEAVKLGRAAGAEISVRGGGHNVAGRAVTDGGLMIDLAPMIAVEVDVAAGTVRAEPGMTWGHLDQAAAEFGLATTGGQVSTTGIAGLTLGGGFGYLMGAHGLAVDNLLAAEVVTATGEIVTASDGSGHEDLFWAVRGGGGNFGIATSFLYQAYPLDTVLGGIVAHPLTGAVDAISFYRQFTAAGPDELGVACGLVHAPDQSGQKIVAFPLCHAGHDEQRADADVKPLRQYGQPVLDSVARIAYPEVNTLLDGAFPKGALNYWKSAFLRDLSDVVISVVIDAYERVPSPMSIIVIEHLHGAATRVPVTETAFPHRQAGYNVLLIAQWTDPSDTQPNIAWAQETFAALRPHLDDRRYMNYLSADDAGAVREAYGPNYERLTHVKRRYDPDNLFRMNLNIEPAPS